MPNLINSTRVQERYQISPATLYRWLDDESVGFPKPAYIRKRPYWRTTDLDAFDERQFEPEAA